MKIAINVTFNLHGGSLVHFKYILNEWVNLDIHNEYLVLTTPKNLKKFKFSILKISYKIFRIPAFSHFIKV